MLRTEAGGRLSTGQPLAGRLRLASCLRVGSGEGRWTPGPKPDTSWAVMAGMAWLIAAGGQRSRVAAPAASWSLSPITVAPELTGRGGVGPQVALRSNSRKKS
jgi:hypothetical protein